MLKVSFSLTQQVIINPVLKLRAAPLDTQENPLTIPGRISHFFQSEVATRIIAIGTSIFAAVDFGAHLGTGIVKGVHLGLRKIGIRCLSPAPTGQEIGYHFKQSAKFLGITALGSIAATVCPGVLRSFQNNPFLSKGTSSSDWKNTSETVQNLWNQTTDKITFEKRWEKASINDQRTFVQLVDEDSTSKGIQAKSDLVDTVYRKNYHRSNEWPKQNDVEVFYHATTWQGLKGILKSRKIEVRHEKAYRGAFVSTKPETGFGKYILVFNRNIERISQLNHGFSVGNAYWAGFSHDIPVNEMTLSRILIHNGNYDEASKLADSCNIWTGRQIDVENLSPHNQISDQDIPKEWPGADPKADAIEQTMKIRIKQQRALEIKKSLTIPKHQSKQGRMMILAH
jgi:hypothetical protein